ncbi:MAG TPA: hypothetical protein VJ725_30980 [Thermoanaerobaculia bacterium]|nr:hypothetical protein [Thermoanaerobaculia bacterium]
MATVTTNWVGRPVSQGGGQSRRTASDVASAFGFSPETEEERAARTGVDRGGEGYVSGQVNPGAARTGAELATTGTGSSTPPPAGGGYRVGHAADPNTVPLSPFGGPTFGGAGDVTTKASALSVPVGVDTSGAKSNAGGTTTGQSPIPVGGRASPSVAALNQVSPGLGDQFDVGGNLLTPAVADLTPALNSQARAFGLDQNLAQERFDYRPGAAPSQERVALDKAAQDEIRAKQLSNLEDLFASASGQVASPAEIQLRQAAARNAATNFGAARALGGRSFGGATRAATVANAEAGAQTNVDAAMLRATEQERARQALIQALSGTRGQDIDVAGANANLAQAANANNLRAQMDQNALAEQHRLALLKAQLDALGIGTQAGVGAVNAAAKNAENENEAKAGVLKGASAFLGL